MELATAGTPTWLGGWSQRACFRSAGQAQLDSHWLMEVSDRLQSQWLVKAARRPPSTTEARWTADPRELEASYRPPQTKKKDWQHSSLGSLVADPLVLCECPPDASNTGSAELAGGGTIWSKLRFEPRPPAVWPTPRLGPPRRSGGLGTGSTELGLNRPRPELPEPR